MDQLQLIKKAKSGDVAAFTELYKAVYKKLYQYALYTLNNSADAEDAVSETIVDAFDSIKQLRKSEAFDGWIFKILQAKCNRKLREIIASRNVVDFESYTQNTGNEPEAIASEINQIALRIDLEQALATLPPLDREIISLHVLLGYTTKEIAKMLGQNENTIRSREARALKRMRATVKEVM